MKPIQSFGALDELRRQLAQLPAVGSKVAADVAPQITDLARASFDAGLTPFGTPMGATLNRSGRLRSQAVNYQATGRLVRASVGAVPYARYQLKHGYLPRGGGPIPQSWADTIDRAAQAELTKAVGA